MEKESRQEVVVPQISSSRKRPVLEKDDREVCEAWLIVPDFVFPSTSRGATGSTQLRSKSPSPSIALKLPINPFTSKGISNMRDRLNLSAGKRTVFMGSILTEGGVPLEKATLSIKRKWTAGKEVRKSSAQAIKATFTAPKHAILHWDGKLVPDFSKENKERLPIFVSGMPDFKEKKVLCIPVITNTTGEEQARTTFSLSKRVEDFR
ncbi:hypothetical protein AVEN_132326-1 [Araneus ventricosus]|uniref:Uncharacterized protein n=1 Tax=Araneus ventricosus TaxID=182803 RepID=A0A4Y2TQX8_ARAVE|nr:hypothetical protein AVEN_117008-1 [Araneus ventricosus]GBO03040.1 hypothetical protein AVEN_132326-1 [Araneus ventricosus]